MSETTRPESNSQRAKRLGHSTADFGTEPTDAPETAAQPTISKTKLAKMRTEARKRRAEGATLAELKRDYKPHFTTEWLEGIAAPTATKSTSKSAPAKPKRQPSPTCADPSVKGYRAHLKKPEAPCEKCLAAVKTYREGLKAKKTAA